MPPEAERPLKALAPGSPDEERVLSELLAFLATHARIAVLTGAGCSTASGLPDYRDDDGAWKHVRPVQFSEFLGSARIRQRYWARSFAGWQRIEDARPNPAHRALARLEADGRVAAIVTQNVDNLHRRAGSRNVLDLHGVLERVRCLGCGGQSSRADLQARLGELNGTRRRHLSALAPDGDAHLPEALVRNFRVPACRECGGVLKPDVVFFGEPVPAGRVRAATAEVLAADALLVVGSSLMVFSGFRFARLAHQAGKPLAILNRGLTRADAFASLKLTGDCGLLAAAAGRLAG